MFAFQSISASSEGISLKTVLPTKSSESELVIPTDRDTLEAQFKLLYRENIRLDKRYNELQVKSKLVHIEFVGFKTKNKKKEKNEKGF